MTTIASARPHAITIPAPRGKPLRSRVATFLKYVSLIAAALATMTPLGVIVIASLKSNAEWSNTGPFALPAHLSFANYVEAFTKGAMVQGLWNTSIILVVSVASSVAIGTMAAYALDRFEFRGRKIVIVAFLLATLVPSITTQVATFRIVHYLGLFNSRWAAIVLFTSTDIVAIYIFLQFMRSIPKDLDEAAALDGANHWTIYWRVVLPLLKPAMATVVIVKGVAVYNEFFLPFLYMPSHDLPMLSTSLFRFKGPFGAHWEVISAGVIIVIIPTLVVFLALQRFIYNGFMAGASK